jgi:signal transduction histidine kinase
MLIGSSVNFPVNEKGNHNNQQTRVLLVEDDVIDQMAFTRFAQQEQLNFDFMIAASVEQAGDVLAKQSFDVILCDYRLGDGTAFDVLALAGNTPLVFITGIGNEDLAVQAMKAGAHDYLVKDVNRAYLHLLPLTIDRILERKWAEMQAYTLAQEKIRRDALNELLHSASHDLRTPLSNLNTSIYLLGKYTEVLTSALSADNPDLALLRQKAEQIHDRYQKLQMHEQNLELLITSMLELAQINLMDHAESTPQDLNMVILQEVEKFSADAIKRGLLLEVYPSNHPVWCRVKIEDWHLLMKHLLDNAFEFTQAGGKVTVQVSSYSQKAVVTVVDTGVGIAPESLKQVFLPFYRGDAARESKRGHGGLGLAIAKRIAELHEGEISVSSIVGQGSRFTVTLPLTIPKGDQS